MLVVLQLIFNPVAGKGRSRRAIGQVERFFTDHGLDYRLLTTEAQGHAVELAASTPPGSTVVVLGGDGTVHEVVKGMLKDAEGHAAPVGAAGPAGALGSAGPPGGTGGRRLATIPVGSGDDFAYALGIPRDNLLGSLQRLLDPKVSRVDVGMVDGEPFVNSMGAGFDAEAAYRVRTSPRWTKGLAAYLYGTLSALGSFRPVSVRVVVDGAEVFEGPSLLVSLQNGPRAGGNFLFAPAAQNDDGQLDVLVAGEFTRASAVAIMPRLMKGGHLDHPRVHMFRGSRVELHWEEPQRGHADGEPLGPRQNYCAALRAAALEVIR